MFYCFVGHRRRSSVEPTNSSDSLRRRGISSRVPAWSSRLLRRRPARLAAMRCLAFILRRLRGIHRCTPHIASEPSRKTSATSKLITYVFFVVWSSTGCLPPTSAGLARSYPPDSPCGTVTVSIQQQTTRTSPLRSRCAIFMLFTHLGHSSLSIFITLCSSNARLPAFVNTIGILYPPFDPQIRLNSTIDTETFTNMY